MFGAIVGFFFFFQLKSEPQKSHQSSRQSLRWQHIQRGKTDLEHRLKQENDFVSDGSTFLLHLNKDKSVTFTVGLLSHQEAVFPDMWGHLKNCLHAGDYSLFLPRVRCGTLTASVALTQPDKKKKRLSGDAFLFFLEIHFQDTFSMTGTISVARCTLKTVMPHLCRIHVQVDGGNTIALGLKTQFVVSLLHWVS